ncbi:DUF2891 domain-containing protein [Solitalea sp. MAHUQ-68]|uniref:DUF2891 domain-containing protein n=1 Tax=Solitalea agri TaxID=2953739 RepID=A0A9X2JB00_9SPHI|nr:DUF2891 domain-containing protein [Solitalea agri]MCO4291952.1 DUF2891 domain-containing protein [Solitalea agri]
MIKLRAIFILAICLTGQSLSAQNSEQTLFNKEIAGKLAEMPLKCIPNEWPNKTSHLSETQADHVLLPHEIHPSFYGCLDWHSSVHGHWMLVKLLKTFKDLPEREKIIAVLENSFQSEKIVGEADYFSKYATAKNYERTYGWAWLLKLDQELYTWDDPLGKKWYAALQPLTKKIVALWTAYLPKQTYPNRTGVHPNTAFGLVFALDWATTFNQTDFAGLIKQRSKEYYLNNQNTPAYLEPDGTDFLSPSLEIADLMRRVLPQKEFVSWFNKFYTKEGITNILKQPVVSDRTDYQIVHLDGLSLSRAWCLKGVSKSLPVNHPQKKLFEATAQKFLVSTMPNVTSGNYGGDHWLASFAVYAIFD